MGETEDAKRWFSWPRIVRSRSAGSPFLVMHTWCPPVRVGYSSRANRTSCEHFFRVSHFARETTLSSFLAWLHIVSGVVCVVCPLNQN